MTVVAQYWTKFYDQRLIARAIVPTYHLSGKRLPIADGYPNVRDNAIAVRVAEEGTRSKMLRHGVSIVTLVIVGALIFAGCGASGDAEEPATSPAVLSVTSGTFTTTVRQDRVTVVPFSETIIVEAAFEEPIYGLAGQTSVSAQASPNTYRIESRPRRNEQTFTFALTNRTPGTVEVSIFESRDAVPVTFSVQVGEDASG